MEAISPEAAEASLREALTAPAPEVMTATDKSESQSQQTATTDKVEGEKQPDSLTTDTLATADKTKQPEATDKNKTETQPEAKGKSEFAKNAERLDKTWKAVNEQKSKLAEQDAQLKAREQAIAQREQKIQLDAVRAKSKFTPEQYEATATDRLNSAEQLVLQAKGLDKQAEEMEAAGEYGKAELAKQKAQDLREQAAGEKYSAKQLKSMAENLRKNPEPTLQQHQATMEQHKKHYLLEAAKVWPDVAKEGSEFQKQMAAHLQAASQSGLDANENPVLFYHVARLTAAETAAARVPGLEKELGAAKARVKELESLTAPSGGITVAHKSESAPADFSKLTLEQQEAQLRLDNKR